MTILIVNIGRSDLYVEIDNHFFPVGYYKQAPNVSEDNLTSDEVKLWHERDEYIEEIFCDELGLAKTEFTFRNLTRKLVDAYNREPEIWHQRIRPLRLEGVLLDSKKKGFDVKCMHLFITNQTPEHESDSIYLFYILKQWFNCSRPDIDVRDHPIPGTINISKDQDALLHFYYEFFSHIVSNIKNDDALIISAKGGTNPMLTALQVQAVASGAPYQLFIDPQLIVKDALNGKPSHCEITSYWQYMSVQKYQIVKRLLLERWDFDGAIQILKDWHSSLKFLVDKQIIDTVLASTSKNVLLARQALNLGQSYLNLDHRNAQAIARGNPELSLSSAIRNYDSALNLYTQCRMFWQLDQVANFLSRLSSYYEGILDVLIEHLSSKDYLNRHPNGNLKGIATDKLDDSCWDLFKQEFKRFDRGFQKRTFSRESNFPLSNRLLKRSFVHALVQSRRRTNETAPWDTTRKALISLDYWAEKRNALIHDAEGLSKNRMQELWLQKEDLTACEPDKILGTLTEIHVNKIKTLNQPPSSYVGTYKDYYIYSEICELVVNKLLKPNSALVPAASPE